MPVKSKKQYKYVWYLRNKYGSVDNAPKKHKWAFESDWTSGVDYHSLPKKKKKKACESVQFFNDFINEKVSIDNILDKINSSGMKSLTRKEKKNLKKYSKRK